MIQMRPASAINLRVTPQGNTIGTRLKMTAPQLGAQTLCSRGSPRWADNVRPASAVSFDPNLSFRRPMTPSNTASSSNIWGSPVQNRPRSNSDGAPRRTRASRPMMPVYTQMQPLVANWGDELDRISRMQRQERLPEVLSSAQRLGVLDKGAAGRVQVRVALERFEPGLAAGELCRMVPARSGPVKTAKPGDSVDVIYKAAFQRPQKTSASS